MDGLGLQLGDPEMCSGAWPAQRRPVPAGEHGRDPELQEVERRWVYREDSLPDAVQPAAPNPAPDPTRTETPIG